MKPILLGYAAGKGMDRITKEDAQRLTHVNVAFGVIRDGLLSLGGLPGLRERAARLRALNPALRIVLSVGGWMAGGFSLMSRTAEGRRAFAASVRQALADNALDGVDIDWEYPCNDAAGIDAHPADKENFTLLLQLLRDTVQDKILSIAAGGGAYFIRDTQMDRVQPLLDYVQIMTYDLGTGSRQTGHHTALYPGSGDSAPGNAANCVALFRQAGVPPEKLVIGAAFYSRVWRGVKNQDAGLHQPADGPAGFGPGYATLLQSYIDQNGYTRYWDPDARAPYLFNGTEFLSYDDPQSLREKCAFVLREGLGGIMYWEHSCDPTGTLLRVMADSLYSA